MRMLVTGGGGFLGEAILKRLYLGDDELVQAFRAKFGEVSLRSFSRGDYPHLSDYGVEQVRGDLADATDVAQAVEGCDLVFHVAAKAGVWGSFDSYYAANVTGTQNVIDACRKQGVGRLVYTSSPSVTFDGKDQENVDESEPYPTKFLAHYPATKAVAEQAVNQANHASLATVSLRPHLIWGPGDNHLLPRIVAQAKAGKLKTVGREGKLVDTTYIDNAVDAHLLAAIGLAPDATMAGKNYFISNGEPMTMEAILNGLLGAVGLPPVSSSVSTGLAIFAGTAMERVYSALSIRSEPRITRFVALQLATAHYFNLSAAKRDLGYEPRVSFAEGLTRL